MKLNYFNIFVWISVTKFPSNFRCCVNSLVNLKLELINAVENEPPKPGDWIFFLPNVHAEFDLSWQLFWLFLFSVGGGPRLEPDALSIGQQKNVHSLTQVHSMYFSVDNLFCSIVGNPVLCTVEDPDSYLVRTLSFRSPNSSLSNIYSSAFRAIALFMIIA